MRDLVQRARTGGLRSSELGSPTVTVTSLGERGAESVTGIIYPPQVAIIGFGTVSSRPWVVDGRVEARPLVTVSLAADHRVTDGHIGARLLTAIERLLQEPDKL
jgi:pyruvate dehydrogenase E2 component (dihydrolipoyllysine-residue acetyltransferase)